MIKMCIGTHNFLRRYVMNLSIKMRKAIALCLSLLSVLLLPLFSFDRFEMKASAVSTDYPAQLINIASKDNSKVLTENGTDDGASLSLKNLGGDLAASWRFDRVGLDSKGTFFKLTNMQSGRLLTPESYNVKAGADVIMYGSESAQCQHWYVIPVENDRLGNGLYYKIVNYSDTSLALTSGSSGMTLTSYTGTDNQLWLLNSDGLQGFAGYCKDDNTGSIKAGDIGGLFGEIVEVSSFDELKKYAESTTPYTILITKNISVTELSFNKTRYMCTAGRIYMQGNKTIVGSYGAHTLFNVQLCTKRHSTTSNNIIIKNLDMQHDAESNHNDSIVCYFSAGENLWVDHVTFTGHNNYGYAPQTKQVDEDKFFACCYDADYCTVSDCSFGGHKYGLILGYPDDTTEVKNTYDNFPRMSIISNKFNDTNTRGPGLMRWGYFHSLNNYVNKFNMAYTVHSGCDIYAENCVYENGGNVICDWNTITYAGAYTESGSKFYNCQRTVQGQGSQSNPAYSKPSYWRPAANYNYKSISADNVKNYCSSYSGCQSAANKISYLRLSTAGVPSAGFVTAPSGPMKPKAAAFADGSTFNIKNVETGKYFSLAMGTGADPHVIQYEIPQFESPSIWKLFSAGDGYYYIALADDSDKVISVAENSYESGHGLSLRQFSADSSDQQFKFIQDTGSANTYTILTKTSNDASALEATGTTLIQQAEVNDSSAQKWVIEPVPDPGCIMDTDVIYTFRNVNSGLVMDIVYGKMENGSNVQQWEQNGYDCQKWILTPYKNTNCYFIRSVQDDSYALKAEGSKNGANIDIAPYSADDNDELFVFSKNLDGSYYIYTMASDKTEFVEVDAAKKDGGANVQQWESTNNSCQKWELLTEAKPVVAGDVNNDGVLSIADAVKLQNWLLGRKSASDIALGSADLDGNGKVNVFDLMILKRKIFAA